MTSRADGPLFSRPELACLVAALLGALGALGVGSAVGGVVAVVSALIVPGYAVMPASDRPEPVRQPLARVAVGAALLSLVFIVALSGSPLGVRPLLAVLLLLAGGAIVARRLLARRGGTTASGPTPVPATASTSASTSTSTTEPIPAPTRWDIVLDDGRVVAGRPGRFMIGRARRTEAAGTSVAEQDEQGDDVVLVSIADSSRLMSRQHVLLDLAGDQPVLVDQGSLNGTSVTAPDGTSVRCEPNVPFPLQPDHVVTFADHRLVLRAAEASAAPVGDGATTAATTNKV